jgi:TPR repeat protein/putative methionine-R-sulfoxide reductase with GAF domain
MATIVQVSRSASSNRRGRVRQKVHVPAYASLGHALPGELQDLHEILDMSECGVALQCSLPLAIDQSVELSLDLAEATGQIFTTARVAWLGSAGRVGLGFSPLPQSAVRRLREWLFLNALAATANAESSASASEDGESFVVRQNYTDILTAASAVQREAESLGSDLKAALALIAFRAKSLLRASGAAIALEGKDAGTMVCRASAGDSAPPAGMSLQVGSGFSGECVRTGKLLRCDDTESDERVDRHSCRALGIRSMLAVPVIMGEKVIGLLEVFSAQPDAFRESDSAVLQRFAETILAAVTRAVRAHDPSGAPAASAKPFSPSPGSVLFAYPPDEKAEGEDASGPQDNVGGIRLPRAHLFLLIAAAATIALALGFILAPWIQEKLQARARNGEQTVLASSKPPGESSSSGAGKLSADSASFAQLRELALRDDPAAENALGLLYAQGDEKQAVRQDEKEAVRWFLKAAEQGNVPAQSKLGSLYLSGRGVTQDSNQAYFWTVLARASGDDASKVLAPFIATRLTRAQRTAIEQQADQWVQRHESSTKAAR